MSRLKTQEQKARAEAAQADFEVVKPYVALFRAALIDPTKEAAADAMFAGFTDSQKDTARMMVFRLTTSGKFHGLIKKDSHGV